MAALGLPEAGEGAGVRAADEADERAGRCPSGGLLSKVIVTGPSSLSASPESPSARQKGSA